VTKPKNESSVHPSHLPVEASDITGPSQTLLNLTHDP
jgi:hypothetical protein